MVKQTVVHTFHRIILSNKNEQAIKAKFWENLQEIILSGKKSIPKDYILHDSIYVTFLKWQTFRNGE